MRNLAALILAALLACASACATTPLAPSSPGPSARSFGRSDSPGFWMAPLNAVTGNNATVIVFDTTDPSTKIAAGGGLARVMFTAFYDQPVTVLNQIRISGSATWRTMNGNGSGDSIAASTPAAISYLILARDQRIEVVTGGTGPSTSETMLGPIFDPALAL